MKIGIIAANSLRLSPYVYYYTGILEEAGLPYEVVVPDRNRDPRDSYPFPVRVLAWNSKAHSLFNYAAYARQVKKLACQAYDFLIVLTTQVAVFSAGWLKKRFNGRYIVDIRDYTYEKIAPYYALEKKAIANAAACVISSAKFRSFLPEGGYEVCHNISTPKEPTPYRFHKAQAPLVVGYVGAVSYADQCRAFMDRVKEDPRFAFHVYGGGEAEPALREYARTLDCDRIRFFGPYKPEEKPEIICKTDLLFNVYGHGYPLVDCALSNKLYDAFYYRKPLLTSPGTFMQEMGGPIGFAVDFENENVMQDLWGWYESLEPGEADAYAQDTFQRLEAENQSARSRVKALLEAMK